MTSFTRTWDSNYVGLPPDSEKARDGAKRIRELKTDIAERFSVDHRLAGDEADGQHLQVTMQALTNDPSLPAGASAGILYCKVQGSLVELYFKDSAGNITPITSALSGFVTVLPGTVLPFANGAAGVNGVAAKGDSYILCNGQAVSRTDFAGLFFAIGVIWGGGDGVNTFNVPDLRGRTLMGSGQGTYPFASAWTSGTLTGEEKHSLLINEIPGHQHTIYSNNSSNAAGSVFAAVQAAVQNSSFLSEMAGGDAVGGVVHAHNNIQPSAVINWQIKT